MEKKQTKQTNQDQNEIKTNWNMNISLGIASIILVTIVMTAILFSRPVHVEAEGWCNSGNVKLDIEAQNIVQEHTCVSRHVNGTTGKVYFKPDPLYAVKNISCFKEDLILDHAALKGIEGLNCQGTVKTDMPFILAWMMG
jgi:hypothetical protein